MNLERVKLLKKSIKTVDKLLDNVRFTIAMYPGCPQEFYDIWRYLAKIIRRLEAELSVETAKRKKG